MRTYRYEMMGVIAELPNITEEVTTQFKSLMAKNNFNFMKDFRDSKSFKPMRLKGDPEATFITPTKKQKWL